MIIWPASIEPDVGAAIPGFEEYKKRTKESDYCNQ